MSNTDSPKTGSEPDLDKTNHNTTQKTKKDEQHRLTKNRE